MKSHELIRQLLQKANAKHLAAEMGLSTSLIYKWAEAAEEAGASGAQNPLDRVEQLARLTDGPRVAQWVCAAAGGFYVKSPAGTAGPESHSLVVESHEIVHEFADMLSAIARAAGDNTITKTEAKDIRDRWQRLQSETEEFVRCCENGNFQEMLERKQLAGKDGAARWPSA